MERSLAFKQYRLIKNEDALRDLRQLIRAKDKYGVYLWDPFLSADDIKKTLFFSESYGVPLRAIGSINKTVKTVYDKKGKNTIEIMADYSTVFNHSASNNLGLNLEFRLQYGDDKRTYGWPFHDRFLIFPGNNYQRAEVYSLGTSINSFGWDHHILQLVSHPQPVVNAFNELWEALNHKTCLVWKYPA